MKTTLISTLAILMGLSACGGQAADDGRNNGDVSTRDGGADDESANGDESGEGNESGGEGDDDMNSSGADDSDDSPGAIVDDPPPTGGMSTPPSTGSGVVPTDPVMMPTPAPIAMPPVVTPGRPVPVPGGMLPVIPPVVDPTPPANCTPTVSTTDISYCQLEQSCDNETLYSYCYPQGDGNWYCDCSSGDFYGYYMLSGVDQNNACNVSANLCTSGTALEFGGDPVCTEYNNPQVDYCDLSVSCTQSAPVEAGITALQTVSSEYASCYNYGTGTLSCQCSTPTASQSYELSGIDTSGACQTTIDLCRNGTPPEFTEPEECVLEYQYPPAGSTVAEPYCERQRRCTQSAAIQDGVEAQISSYDYSSCQNNGAGTATCSCSSAERYLNFDVAAAAGEAWCDEALDFCSGAEAIEPSGPISCTRSSVNAGSPGYCDASLRCTQDATVNGTALGLYGSLYTYCQQAADGSWTCNCSSGVASGSVTVAGTDGFAVCSEATDACQTVIEVQIDSGGYYGGMTPIAPPGVLIPLK